MIINIPIQVSDELVNGLVFKDYEYKIEQNITKLVEDRICRAAGYYRSKSDGIANLVDGVIGDCIEKYKDEIIEKAAAKLEQRISKTKAARELAND